VREAERDAVRVKVLTVEQHAAPLAWLARNGQQSSGSRFSTISQKRAGAFECLRQSIEQKRGLWARIREALTKNVLAQLSHVTLIIAMRHSLLLDL
jgi:hypothetical protein